MIDPLEAAYRRYVREHGVATLFNDEPDDTPLSILTTGKFDPGDTERVMRDTEARGYESYSAIGTEPRMYWLFRLGTVASRKGPHQGPLVRALRKSLKSRTDDVRLGTQR